MGKLRALDEIDSFVLVRSVEPASISSELEQAVRRLHEVDELEPFVRRILFDAGETPHGPAEIVDVLTHKISVQGERTVGGLILKGRSFPTVRPKHVSHQIYRLEKISGLGLAGLFASGVLLDAAK